MNKKLNKLVAGTIAFGMLWTCALAAEPISVSKEGEKVTVVVNSLNPNEETTVLVLPPDVTISEAFEDISVIHHVDQVEASDSGVATFNFKYTDEGDLCIYSGYATMGDYDLPYETVLDLSGSGDVGGDDPGANFTYGDVNGDEMIDTMDALAVIDNFLSGKELAVPEAADVNGDEMVDTMDALDIIDNFLSGKDFAVNKQ